MNSFRTNCKMEGCLRYDNYANDNENASVLSPLPTEDWLYGCPTVTNFQSRRTNQPISSVIFNIYLLLLNEEATISPS